MVLNVGNSRVWEMKAGGSEVQGHPQFSCKFVASLGYMRLCFNKTKTKAEHVGAHHEVSPVETGARRTVCVG